MEQLDELKKRLGEAEKKIQLFDKIVWVAAALAVIFGLSGAFGAKALSSAKQKITELQADLATLQETLSSWKEEVAKGVGALKNQEQESLAAMQRKHGSFLKTWFAIPQRSIEEVRKQEAGSLEALRSQWVMLGKDLEGKAEKARQAMAASTEQAKQELRTAAEKLTRDAQRLYTTRTEFESFRNSLAAGGLSIKCKSLQIVGQGETAVAELSANEDGGLVQVRNAQGKVAGRLLCGSSGGGTLDLYDKDSKRFLYAGLSTDGQPLVFLQDAKSERRWIQMSADKDGGAIRVYSAQGNTAGLVACDPGGSGMLQLHGKEGKRFLYAGPSTEGPLLALEDPKSERRLVQLWAGKDGGDIQVINAQGKTAGQMACKANGFGGLLLADREGKQFLYAGLSTEGPPLLYLQDPKSERRLVQLGADKSGGHMRVLNAQGQRAGSIICDQDGFGALYLANKEGERFLWAGVSTEDQPLILLQDAKSERSLVQLSADKDGGDIQVLNAQGKTAGRITCSQDGSGFFNLYNKEAKRFLWAGLYSDAGGPAVVLTSPETGAKKAIEP